MIQEIFVVEDTEDFINEIKLKFRGKKGFVLKPILSRRIT